MRNFGGFTTGPFTVAGLIGTGLWVIAMAVYYFSNIEAVHSLKPNELGDFLAGWLTPPALIWLVIGYFQQGIELRQNTQALALQVDELRESVKHQGDMVSVAREQLEAEKAATLRESEAAASLMRPSFYAVISGHQTTGGQSRTDIQVSNTRAEAFDVNVSIVEAPDGAQLSNTSHSIWQSSAFRTLTMSTSTRPPFDYVLLFSYSDKLGRRGFYEFDSKLGRGYEVERHPGETEST